MGEALSVRVVTTWSLNLYRESSAHREFLTPHKARLFAQIAIFQGDGLLAGQSPNHSKL